MEKNRRLRGKVKAALVYPLAVLFIALTITCGLMVFIVPKFGAIFETMLAGTPLPKLTQLVMQISDFLIHRAVFGIAGAAVLTVAVRFALQTATGRYVFDMLTIKLPPLAGLTTKVAVARFCSTLSTLMESGVSVLQALSIVRDTSSNAVVAHTVQTVHDAVKEGEGMSRPLAASRVFPGMVVSMIEVGEETGALPEMLSRVAGAYEEEVDRAVEGLTSLIEPVMIIFLALVVGTIVIALFMPLIVMISQFGG
jgi:type IV pilus assembly protein PilC